ncbi:MAG: acetyl-CoA C-acyltransferase [Chitinophagaceae bacterium]
MREVFIVGMARTPIGSFQGALSSLPATQLGAVAIRAAVSRSGVRVGEIQELLMGQVLTADAGQAPANQASIAAGIPTSVPCSTINKVCASGMKAIMIAAQGILLGYQDLVVAGGMESMSNTPYYLDKARKGYRLGNGWLKDGILRDGLWDPYQDYHMGNAAEICASTYRISRQDQDSFAAESYRRAAMAYEKEFFKSELVGVDLPGKSPSTVTADEEFTKVNLQKMGSLHPAFQQDGTITAANASKINDGAAAVVLASGEKVKELGLVPLVKVISFADASQDPQWFTTAPIPAVKTALARAGLQIQDMDFAEINEAFSCVPLVNQQALGLRPDQVNIWGGAVALGHPIGCSGARIVITLASILRHHQARFGVAAICNGGGGASAMVLEALPG